MSRTRLYLLFGVSLCLAVFLLRLMADDGEDNGLTVQITAHASDTHPLHYHWKSTDGVIKNVDAATTSWKLPSGPGLHYAYVLVSNHLGGYTERRIGINTDTLARGTETETEGSDDDKSRTLHAPPAPAQTGDYYRARVDFFGANAAGNDVYLPNASVFLQDQHNSQRYPKTGFVPTDQKGQYVIAGVPGSGDGSEPFGSANDVAISCELFGVVYANCGPDNFMLGAATSDYHTGGPLATLVVGTFTLADGSPCGTYNEFFGVHATAKATLLDSSNHVLAGPVDVNEFGDYALPPNASGHTVSLSCEDAGPVTVPYVNGNVLLQTKMLSGANRPNITDITATLHGQPLSAPVARFLPPPTGLPSDISHRTDNYLAQKGLDSRLGGCKYYQAIGAVKGCGKDGELIGAINYQEWQKAVQIGKYAKGKVPTYQASYINKVDLNLARVHQSITYGPDQTAAVVCNHLGASDFLNPTQTDIDDAVESAVANKNLVACVAMDYSVSPGVNNNKPFVRFLIFGPSGELLPSVNLDGVSEKFVPGTCVVCHGGDHYAGKFPEDGSGFANVGGHFLPYDAGNFEFASKPGLQRCDQEDAIYHLNQNILNAGPTNAETELVSGWYSSKGSAACPPAITHVLDEEYLPPSWAKQDKTSTDFYQNVIARSCRTCHVAMLEGLNFDHYQNIVTPNANGTKLLPGGSYDMVRTICQGNGFSNFLRSFTMPNSLVTFNRFWLSNQPQFLMNFANDTGNGGSCQPVP